MYITGAACSFWRILSEIFLRNTSSHPKPPEVMQYHIDNDDKCNQREITLRNCYTETSLLARKNIFVKRKIVFIKIGNH